ncbi:ABC transporter permease [Roseivivax sediminis]|uniref:Capsular polysaccharide transport system permease protein n=1 Tax=Roseivivax sediminis TaxID=936889 RepID=A0A1I2ACV8_9RHOB|nr:ABC transporter permease [Roseivivax sediminis]SFE41649.1 capsular polysaccharide transport system permease protein [Roseivivax sediminis]
MSEISVPRPPAGAARPPTRRFATPRVIVALMLREMSTTNGRSPMGYLWAILEPVAGIALLSLVFAAGFRSPPIGTNFAIFFASGVLPFLAYVDLNNKVATAQRFSKPLLSYPGVTFIDTIVSRVILNAITQSLICFILFTGIIVMFDLDMILNVPAIALGYVMAFSLSIGIGTLNSYFLTIYPIWEKIWAIFNRPLFIISCVIFLYDTVPQPYRDWLWWNPLIHIVGQTRSGVFATYDGSYVSYVYIFSISAVTFAAGLVLLRRYHRDMINV